MRHALSFLAAITLIPETSSAQLTAEAITKFVVPDANALAVSIALHGNTVLLGTLDAEAYVFQLDRGVWFMDRLVVPGVGLQRGSFAEVALAEDLVIIGDSPHAYIFRFDGATWNYEVTLTHIEGNRGFGHTVDIDGDLAVVGTRSDDVHVVRFNGGGWAFEAKLVPPPREDGEDPYGYADQVVNEIHAVDPDVAITSVTTMKDCVERVLGRYRVGATVVGLFGSLALALAAIGLYGVLSYLVVRRTRAIGIQMALGATRARVARSVVGEGFKLALFGIALGIPLAFVAVVFIESFLYGIDPKDPTTFAMVPLVLAPVAYLAAFLPARRASRVNPMDALRQE